MGRIFIIALSLWICGLTGCKRDERDTSEARRESRPVVTDVVARVGGRSIGAAQVRERMRSENIAAKAALEDLIDEELLLAEAERTGLSAGRRDEQMVERMMVRALLRDLEKGNAPEQIPESEVREDFALHAEKFQVFERRSSRHVLVREQSEEARLLAQSVLDEIRRTEDSKEVFARYSEGPPDGVELPVLAEELPAITQKAGFEKSYKDALFAAKVTGPLKAPVKSSYGWHAIVVTEIQPGETRTWRDVEEEIRERLSQKKRFEMLAEVVRKLEAEGLVEYQDDVVERLLAMRSIPERGE